MVIVHRPQATTELVYSPIEYYYNRPQDVFGPGENISPGLTSEKYDEGGGMTGGIQFNEMGEIGHVLVEQS